jgi:hypothetical protein
LKAKKLRKLPQEKVLLERCSWVGCERGPFGLFSQRRVARWDYSHPAL